MRAFWFLLMFLVIAGFPSSGEDGRPRLGNHPDMTATPVPLDPHDPSRVKVDALTYLGGVQLHSKDPAFGGFSSMLVEGDHFTLLSDGGNVVWFRMGADFKPFDVRFGDLTDGPGYGWGKGSRDSESMTIDPVTRKIWVGFEGTNHIWRYNKDFSHGEAKMWPFPMRHWDQNGGAESMVRMRNGAFVVIAETSHQRGIPGRAALYFPGDPTDWSVHPFVFGFRPPDGGYDPSDMVQLPDGRLLVLVRRISINRWFESKLVVFDPKLIRPGVSIRGQEIAGLTIPLTRDNFEALAVSQENGATILWIASDDNLAFYQRSLLMKFRLDL
jgi:hypothetical protein